MAQNKQKTEKNLVETHVDARNDFRQTSTNFDLFSRDACDEHGNYKYKSLNNVSSSYSNDSRLDEEETQTQMVKSNSDQKLPDAASQNSNSNGFYYVNKKGFVQSVASPDKSEARKNKNQQVLGDKTNPLICTNLILEVYKNNKESKKQEAKVDKNSNRSVPNQEFDLSMSSLNASTNNNSLVQRDLNGHVLINTNLTIQEPNIDISYDHVKYINLFSILCCWCFPFTGLVAIFYSRLTKKFYNMRDMEKAKKYLNRSEWMLMLTFFFGLTLIAVMFALLEAHLFKSVPHGRLNGGIFHTRSLSPK